VVDSKIGSVQRRRGVRGKDDHETGGIDRHVTWLRFRCEPRPDAPSLSHESDDRVW
jgi:hypothetical protein